MLSRGASLHDAHSEPHEDALPQRASENGHSEIVALPSSDYDVLDDEGGISIAELQENGAASPGTQHQKCSLHENTKYRSCTRSPSDGDDVRWYFCKAAFSLHEVASSIPATEVISKSDFFRFSLRDSISLEEEFLKNEEELVSSWWKEYAECSEGPSRSGKEGTTPSISRASSEFYEDAVGVPVKGGLYEVDLISRRCFPVYWNGEHRRVLRGHWFAQRGTPDWLPLREDIAEQLELAYSTKVWERRAFQPSGQFAARVDFLGATTPGLHALFTGEEDTWEAWLNVDTTGISSMFGLSATAFRLRRGFVASESLQLSQDELRQKKEEEIDDYCSEVAVRHLVFMVHGIGQRLEKANLVDDVGTFRRTVASLAEKHLTHYQRHKQRVLFIPCQWRRHLKLGGESAVEECTLEGVRALRTMVGATVHDVLYYMSPIYCQDIIDSVSSSLNMLFDKFMKRNPGYDGKISIYGHSLGSVLSYDILSHQEVLASSFPLQDVQTNVVEDLPQENSEEINDKELATKEGRKQVSGEVEITDKELDTSEARKMDKGSGGMKPEVEETEATAEGEKPVSEESWITEATEEGKKPGSGEVEITDKESASAEGMQPVSWEERHEVTTDEPERVTESPKPEEEALELGSTENQLRDEVSRLSSKVKALEESLKVASGHLQSLPSRRHHTPRINYTKLSFQVDTFFAVGSPLGLFLSLRSVRIGTGKGQEYWEDENIEEEMPCCRQMMNIFHPYDPVAYRVEPLISKDHVGKRPVFIPYHKGGKRLHIGMQEFGEDLGARSRALVNSLASVGTRVASAFSRSDSKKLEKNVEEEQEQPSYGSLVMERLTGSRDGRVDFMLQDATFEHQYIAAISSHTNYWHDPDTALFILRHLYQEIPEQSPAKVRAEEEAKSRLLSEYGGYIEDDLPLTFSSKEGIAAEMAAADETCTRLSKSRLNS